MNAVRFTIAQRRVFYTIVTVVCVLIIIFTNNWFKHNSSESLIISAAASVQPVMLEIKEVYQQSHPQVNVTYNFGA